MAAAQDTVADEMVSSLAEQERGAAAMSSVDSPEWFSGLVKQHLRRVYGMLYRMVGHREDAQDLAQDVFLKAYQRRHQLREAARVLPWLLRIASNAAIDFQRSRAVTRFPEEWNDDLQTDAGPLSPEQQLLRDERGQRLHRALRLLSPKERAAIVLRDLEGLSGIEVARALGCSPITVRTHIASARMKLRRALSAPRRERAPEQENS